MSDTLGYVQVKAIGGLGKEAQAGLEASLMYEIQHQAATVTDARLFSFGHTNLMRGCFVVQGEQHRRVVVGRLKSSSTKDLQTVWENERHLRIMTRQDQDSAPLKEDGYAEAVGACLLSVETLQRTVKRGGHVASCQHWGRGCQTGCVAGVRRGGTVLLSSAVTAACIRVAALEFPERHWAAVDVNQYENLVRAILSQHLYIISA